MIISFYVSYYHARDIQRGGPQNGDKDLSHGPVYLDSNLHRAKKGLNKSTMTIEKWFYFHVIFHGPSPHLNFLLFLSQDLQTFGLPHTQPLKTLALLVGSVKSPEFLMTPFKNASMAIELGEPKFSNFFTLNLFIKLFNCFLWALNDGKQVMRFFLYRLVTCIMNNKFLDQLFNLAMLQRNRSFDHLWVSSCNVKTNFLHIITSCVFVDRQIGAIKCLNEKMGYLILNSSI